MAAASAARAIPNVLNAEIPVRGLHHRPLRSALPHRIAVSVDQGRARAGPSVYLLYTSDEPERPQAGLCRASLYFSPASSPKDQPSSHQLKAKASSSSSRSTRPGAGSAGRSSRTHPRVLHRRLTIRRCYGKNAGHHPNHISGPYRHDRQITRRQIVHGLINEYQERSDERGKYQLRAIVRVLARHTAGAASGCGKT